MKKILLVDDDPLLLRTLEIPLRRHFEVVTASSGDEALALFGEGEDFSVVVADMLMPGMNGIELLQRVRQISSTVIRMMLTANAQLDAALKAVNQGHIFYFMVKPCPMDEMIRALESAVRQHQLVIAEKELLEQTLKGSLNVLTEILSMVAPPAFGRALILKESMRRMAVHLNLPNVWLMEIAGMLSPIGLVTIPPELVKRAKRLEPLTERETHLLERVPEVGRNLLAHIPRMEEAARIVYYQAKNYDGTGFPGDAVAGDQIPLGSRLLKLLNDYLSLESKGHPRDEIWNRLAMRSGMYDPELLKEAGACMGSTPAEKVEQFRPVQSISFRDLKTGQILARNVETLDGQLIVSAPYAVTPSLKELLRNFSGIAGIKEPLFIEAPQLELSFQETVH